MTKIYSPNKEYTGISAGVSFVKGVGETDDNWRLQWFKNKGYKIGVEEGKEQEEDSNEEEIEEKELNDLTVKELREMAKDRGLEGYSDLKKDTLIELLKGE